MKKEELILCICIFLAMLAYGMTLPLFTFIIDYLNGEGMHLGLLISIYGIMQLLFAPIWGKLSDNVGRKPIILLGMFGLSFSMILFYFSRSFLQIYFAQLIMGALTSCIFPVSIAYITDMTNKNNQTQAIGKIGASMGFGVVIGPGIGGILASKSLFFPFLISSILSFLTIFFIIFFLPNIKIIKNKSKENKFFNFKKIFTSLNTKIGIGLILVFASYFKKSNFSSIFGLYALQRFNYGILDIGIILMIVSIIYVFVQGVLIGILVKKYSHKQIIKMTLIGNSIGFILLILSNSFLTLLFSVCFLIVFNAILKPISLSYILKNSKGNKGEIMGIADTYMGFGRIVGPLWAGFVFDINMFFPFITGIIFFIFLFGFLKKKNCF